MKHALIILLFIAVATTCSGSHLIGGSIGYRFIQELSDSTIQYEIEVLILRDAANSTVDFDNTILVGIYDASSSRIISTETISLGGRVNETARLCVNQGSNFNIEKGVYRKMVTVPKLEGGYYYTFERCCRSYTDNTLVNSSLEPDQPFYFITKAPIINNMTMSSKLQLYAASFCVGTKGVWNFEQVDADGDSIGYELVDANVGHAELGVYSIPEPSDTFIIPKAIKYKSGFSGLRPVGIFGSVVFKKNKLNVLVNESGTYTVAIKVSEYRDGRLIGMHYLDAVIIVLHCGPSVLTNTPSGLRARVTKHLQTTLTWNACDKNVSHFRIDRSKGVAKAFDSIGYTLNSSYIDTTMGAPGKYFYKVIGSPLTNYTSGVSNIDSVRFNNLKVQGINKDKRVIIYPNPTKNTITINGKVELRYCLIKNKMGQALVEIDNIESNQVSVDVSNLTNGLYFIEITTAEGQQTLKFVKR
ncbi:MAG: hypothetical protein ACI9JN_002066 [Bacteroidia bacterium]|jgi:hypothetical protein